MKGRISLKDFIHGVKRELLDTSESSKGVPAFEMTEIELEAEFILETVGKLEGGFAVFVKAEGEVTTSQTHKVKITMRPLKPNPNVGFITDNALTETPVNRFTMASLVSTPLFVDAPGTYTKQGFPYVQFDPSKLIHADDTVANKFTILVSGETLPKDGTS